MFAHPFSSEITADQDYVNNLMANNDESKLLDKANLYTDEIVERGLFKPAHIASIDELLADNFIVGEVHDSFYTKSFLIENMLALRLAGFTTLFFEHLYYDDQDQLDSYSVEHPKQSDNKLTEQLEKLDWSQGVPNYFGPDGKKNSFFWKKNNFSMLFQAAKLAGIRIVALDCRFSYQAQNKHMKFYGDACDNFRSRTFTYTASNIIEREMQNKNEKWFGLVGNTHLKEYENTPGLCDVTGARAVSVSEGGFFVTNPHFSFNQQHDLGTPKAHSFLSVEVDIQMPKRKLGPIFGLSAKHAEILREAIGLQFHGGDDVAPM